MKKTIVKILKRVEISKSKSPQISVVDLTTEIQMSVAQTVDGWITERRANSQAETAASVSTIAAWRVIPETA